MYAMYYWSGELHMYMCMYVCTCISFTIYVCNDNAPCCPEIDTDNWRLTDLMCGLCLTVIKCFTCMKPITTGMKYRRNVQIHLPRLPCTLQQMQQYVRT